MRGGRRSEFGHASLARDFTRDPNLGVSFGMASGQGHPVVGPLPSGALLVPPGVVLFDYDGDNIDGASNGTLTPGAALTSWVNRGTVVGATMLQPGVVGIRPTYAPAQGAGGHGCVASNGSQYMMSNIFTLVPQPITWGLVTKSVAVGTEVLYSGSNANRNQIYLTGTSVNLFNGAVIVTGLVITANTHNALGNFANGAASVGRVNGVSTGLVNAGALQVDQVGVFSGPPYPSSNATGNITRLLGVTGASLTQLFAYLTAKYGAFPQ